MLMYPPSDAHAPPPPPPARTIRELLDEPLPDAPAPRRATDAAVAFVAPRSDGFRLGASEVIVEVAVAPDPRNRWLVVEWDSDLAQAGRFVVALAGAEGPRVHRRRLVGLGPGVYQFVATVHGVDGGRPRVRGRAERRLVILGPPGAHPTEATAWA